MSFIYVVYKVMNIYKKAIISRSETPSSEYSVALINGIAARNTIQIKIAKELYRRGWSLVLIGKDRVYLENMKETIPKCVDVIEPRIIVCSLEGIDEVLNEISRRKLSIGVFINMPEQAMSEQAKPVMSNVEDEEVVIGLEYEAWSRSVDSMIHRTDQIHKIYKNAFFLQNMIPSDEHALGTKKTRMYVAAVVEHEKERSTVLTEDKFSMPFDLHEDKIVLDAVNAMFFRNKIVKIPSRMETFTEIGAVFITTFIERQQRKFTMLRKTCFNYSRRIKMS